MLSVSNPQRVLVIDDDPLMCELLVVVLGEEEHTVVSAENGDQALEALRSAEPADAATVVLADLHMPGLSGAKLGERLRAACRPGTKLLAMSGSKPDPDEAAAYDGFLMKPFTVADFAAALGEPNLEVKKPEQAPLSASVVLNEDIYGKLAEMLPAAELHGLYVMCLDDGLERIGRMRTAAAAGDAGTFTREAHSIKGGCGMLGATELHGLAGEMETGALTCTPLLEDFTLAAGRLRRMLDART